MNPLLFILFFALLALGILLLSLVYSGMLRLRKTLLLHLLAQLVRQGRPLEPALVALAEMEARKKTAFDFMSQNGFRVLARCAQGLRQSHWKSLFRPLKALKWNAPGREVRAGQGLAIGPIGLLDDLACHLKEGGGLPEGLVRMNIIHPLEALGLASAPSSTAQAEMLGQLAHDHKRKIQDGLANLGPGVVFPILVTAGMAVLYLFYDCFILPKFRLLGRELSCPIAVIPFWAALLTLAPLFSLAHLLGSLDGQGKAGKFWFWFPWSGNPVRLRAQAAFARALGLALDAGLTLEKALCDGAPAGIHETLKKALIQAREKMLLGIDPLEALRSVTKWRQEMLWAFESLAGGAPPGKTFRLVAEVLEKKAYFTLAAIQGVGFPLALVLAAVGVGLTFWSIFGSLLEFMEAMMR